MYLLCFIFFKLINWKNNNEIIRFHRMTMIWSNHMPYSMWYFTFNSIFIVIIMSYWTCFRAVIFHNFDIGESSLSPHAQSMFLCRFRICTMIVIVVKRMRNINTSVINVRTSSVSVLPCDHSHIVHNTMGKWQIISNFVVLPYSKWHIVMNCYQ